MQYIGNNGSIEMNPLRLIELISYMYGMNKVVSKGKLLLLQ